MNSPLKQVNLAPSSHKPKAAAQYSQLFSTNDHSPGYWVEFFILPISTEYLEEALNAVPRELIVADPVVLQTLFRAGISNLESQDLFIATNSLSILQLVLKWLLDQKFPAQEVLATIAPLHKIDHVFDDFSRGLSSCLERDPRVALGFLSTILRSAQGTSIAAFFSSRNMFRPLVGAIDTPYAANALTLVGIFCLLNKRQDNIDPYRERISDFVDEDAILKSLFVIQTQMALVAPQNPKSWLGWLQKSGPVALDSAPLPILHFVYEFCTWNELFSVQLVRSTAFASLFAACSHVVQDQTLAPKYGLLILFIYRALVERSATLAELCNHENDAVLAVAQTRNPPIALDTAPRVPLAAVLDTVQCCLRFNIRRKLDLNLYRQALSVLLQVLTSLKPMVASTVKYDWPQLWRTLFSVLNHLAKPDVEGDAELSLLLLQSIAAFCIEPALTTPQEYLNLVAKAASSQELMGRFSLKYGLSSTCPAIDAATGQYQLLATEPPERMSDGDRVAQMVKQARAAQGKPSVQRFSEYAHRRYFADETRTLLNDYSP